MATPPSLFREGGGSDKGKEGGGDGFSKTKMLITLKTEVANVRAQIQEEQTKREHMQDWIRDTLKPTLVEMKKEYSEALRDLNSAWPTLSGALMRRFAVLLCTLVMSNCIRKTRQLNPLPPQPR